LINIFTVLLIISSFAPTNGTTANGSIPSDSFNGAIKEEASVKKALEEEEQMLHKLKV
jgi:hypothetical protein